MLGHWFYFRTFSTSEQFFFNSAMLDWHQAWLLFVSPGQVYFYKCHRSIISHRHAKCILFVFQINCNRELFQILIDTKIILPNFYSIGCIKEFEPKWFLFLLLLSYGLLFSTMLNGPVSIKVIVAKN